jgi:hypothetical protein
MMLFNKNMGVFRAIAVIFSCFSLAGILTSCSTSPDKSSIPMSADTKLLLVLVGGNSESIHDGGIWKLYKGRDQASCGFLLPAIRSHTGLAESEISTHYFSWTGDTEDDRDNVLPGHWDWILGGSKRINESLETRLKLLSPEAKVAIIGWSNGGATAYELACRLARVKKPDLLVTLDPVSWTTTMCSSVDFGPAIVANAWIDVYTRSGPLNRLNFGNIIALFGRAWNEDNLPGAPTRLHRHYPGNHSDTQEMLRDHVFKDQVYLNWAESFN